MTKKKTKASPPTTRSRSGSPPAMETKLQPPPASIQPTVESIPSVDPIQAAYNNIKPAAIPSNNNKEELEITFVKEDVEKDDTSSPTDIKQVAFQSVEEQIMTSCSMMLSLPF